AFLMGSLATRHLQVLVECLGRMSRRPLSTAMTLAGIGVALAVPLVLYLLVSNLASVFGEFGATPKISAYLEIAVDAEYADTLAQQLAADPAVRQVKVIDKDEGLAELLAQGSLNGIEAHLDGNPLPHVIEVHPVAGMDKLAYRDLGERIHTVDGVEDVQIDLDWVERLRAITDLVMVAVRAFWALLFAGVAMVIANSVRLGLVTAREEIEVISLVGGSESFIRRPYLYLGLLQGALGALLAVVISFVVYLLLSPSLESVLRIWLGVAEVRFAPFAVLARMVFGAGLVGWAAAWLSTRRYLRDILPG
ncbi:MAG: hypothetical protein DWQ08_02945, partial [Proteobacteria bacterium]